MFYFDIIIIIIEGYKMKILIIIPAFNEEANIEKLVKKIEQLEYDYIVINDCSTDSTAALLDEKKLIHLDLDNNIGLAGVTQIGFKYAVDCGYGGAIVIDGDGQHPPIYIKSLIDKILDGYDYVVGSRFVDKPKPFTFRMIGSRILSVAIKFKTGINVSDPTSGMRAIGGRVLKDFVKNMNFIAEPDALCYILKQKYKYTEIQVDMEEREGGVSYFVNPIRSIKFMFDVLISILLFQW